MNFLSRWMHSDTDTSKSDAQADSSIEPAEASRRQSSGALLVDVREPDEWQVGHAPGATHIPLGQLRAGRADLPRDREVLLICRSGGRSQQAQQVLRAAGHRRAVNVAGGMIAWGRAGLPVVS